jgi:hypothetical protein
MKKWNMESTTNTATDIIKLARAQAGGTTPHNTSAISNDYTKQVTSANLQNYYNLQDPSSTVFDDTSDGLGKSSNSFASLRLWVGDEIEDE